MTLKRLATTIGVLSLYGAALVPPAFAQNPSAVEQMKDLQTTHWAYQAIKDLVDRYQIMQGFPDNTFQGQRTLSRYEMAAALRKVMTKAEEMITAAVGTGGVPPGVLNDLKTIKDLQDEFKKELEQQRAALDKFRNETDTRFKNLEDAIAALKPTGPNVKFGGSWRGSFWYDFDNPKTHYMTTAQLNFSSAVKFNDQLSFDGLLGGTFVGKLFASGLQDSLKPQAANTVKVKKALLSYSVTREYNFKVKVGFAPLPDVDLYSDIASKFGDFGAVYNPFIQASDDNPAISPATGFGSSPDVSAVPTEFPGGDTVLSLSAGMGALTANLGFTTKIVAGGLAYDFGYGKFKIGGSYDQVGIVDAGGTNKPAQTVVTAVIDITPLLTTKVQDPTGKLVPFDPETSSYNINGTIQINAVDSGRAGDDIFNHKDIGFGVAGKLYNFDLGLMTSVWIDKETNILFGGYLGTPKLFNSVTLLFGMQDPFFTDKSGTLQEGIGQSGNQAGFSLIAKIDNPVFPNLELEYANSSDILFSSTPFRDVFMVRMSTKF